MADPDVSMSGNNTESSEDDEYDERSASENESERESERESENESESERRDPQFPMDCTNPSEWPESYAFNTVAYYAIFFTQLGSMGMDDKEYFDDCTFEFKERKNKDDNTIAPWYECIFEYDGFKGLYSCELDGPTKTKFKNFTLLAWTRMLPWDDHEEHCWEGKDLNLVFVDDVLDDQGRPLLNFMLLYEKRQGRQLVVSGWGRLYDLWGKQSNFSAEEIGRIRAFEEDEEIDDPHYDFYMDAISGDQPRAQIVTSTAMGDE